MKSCSLVFLAVFVFIKYVQSVPQPNPSPLTTNTKFEKIAEYKQITTTSISTTTTIRPPPQNAVSKSGLPSDVEKRADQVANSIMSWVNQFLKPLVESEMENKILDKKIPPALENPVMEEKITSTLENAIHEKNMPDLRENRVPAKKIHVPHKDKRVFQPKFPNALDNILKDPETQVGEVSNRIDRSSWMKNQTGRSMDAVAEDDEVDLGMTESSTPDNLDVTTDIYADATMDDAETGNNDTSRVVEISHPAARQLCRKLKDMYKSEKGRSGRSYLWAPIYQYAPALDRGFPLTAPEFTPDCMKWRMKACNGTVRFPLMDPCTYWAPMPLKSPKCFSTTPQSDNERVVYVNYRPPEYNMTVCPCRWPCTPEFDRIQYCRVNQSREEEDDALSKHEKPKKLQTVKIPQYSAMQLCRGMKDFLEKKAPIRIDTIPIRIRSLSKIKDKIQDCVIWKYSPCKLTSDDDEEQDNSTRSSKDEENTSTTVSSQDSSRKRRSEYKNLVENGEMENEDHHTKIDDQSQNCDIWEQTEDPECKAEIPVERLSGGNKAIRFKSGPGSEKQDSSSSSSSNGKLLQDFSYCHGKWPCFLTRKKRAMVEDEKKWIQIQPRQKSKSHKGPSDKEGFTLLGHFKTKHEQDKPLESVPEEKPEEIQENDIPQDTEKPADSQSSNAEPAPAKEAKEDFIDPKTFKNLAKGPGCNCDFPCVPFFDSVNKCYNKNGDLLVDSLGKPIILPRRFSRTQKQLVLCLSYLEKDAIDCFIKS